MLDRCTIVLYIVLYVLCYYFRSIPCCCNFKKSPDPSETTGLTLETSYRLIAKLLTVEKHAAENSNWF